MTGGRRKRLRGDSINPLLEPCCLHCSRFILIKWAKCSGPKWDDGSCNECHKHHHPCEEVPVFLAQELNHLIRMRNKPNTTIGPTATHEIQIECQYAYNKKVEDYVQGAKGLGGIKPTEAPSNEPEASFQLPRKRRKTSNPFETLRERILRLSDELRDVADELKLLDPATQTPREETVDVKVKPQSRADFHRANKRPYKEVVAID
ncbi:hypothetical protein MMC10_007561 [Thelotrema lepadinum]|nr:hypothetical protein [Thelotrema lepadinum]